jgi:hypothetical protein
MCQKRIFFEIFIGGNDGDVNIVDVVVWLRDDCFLVINFIESFCFKALKTRFEHKNPKQTKNPGREFITSNRIHDHVCPITRAKTNKSH